MQEVTLYSIDRVSGVNPPDPADGSPTPGGQSQICNQYRPIDQSTSRARIFSPGFAYFVYFGIEHIDQHADAKYTKKEKLWFRRYAHDLTYAYAPKVQTPLQPEGYKTTVFPMKRATEKRIPSPNLPQLRKAITSTALFSIGIAICPM